MMIKVQSILVQVPPISQGFPFSNAFELLLSIPAYYLRTGAESLSASQVSCGTGSLSKKARCMT